MGSNLFIHRVRRCVNRSSTRLDVFEYLARIKILQPVTSWGSAMPFRVLVCSSPTVHKNTLCLESLD
jgi:hypothetical protein